MANKWDEITQLQEAYEALATQPRDAQIRMVQWLSDRLEADYRKAIAANEATLKRIADRDGEGQ